jgi:hypothetical protein
MSRGTQKSHLICSKHHFVKRYKINILGLAALSTAVVIMLERKV